MTNRIVIALITAWIVAPIAFGQMRYSREHKASPTPSPTPTPTPGARAPFSQLPQTPPPRTFTAPQTTAAPSQQRIPAQRTFSGPPVTPTPSPSRIPAQRTFGAPLATPTLPPGQMRMPAQRTLPAQQTTTTQSRAQVPPQRTLSAAQPTAAPMQPQILATPTPKPTPPPAPPPDVKAYLGKQLKSDGKFHMNINGRDVGLTPFHYWAPRPTGYNTTSTHVDMRSDDGRIYDIDFAATGSQVSSIRIHRINGEAVR